MVSYPPSPLQNLPIRNTSVLRTRYKQVLLTASSNDAFNKLATDIFYTLKEDPVLGIFNVGSDILASYALIVRSWSTLKLYIRRPTQSHPLFGTAGAFRYTERVLELRGTNGSVLRGIKRTNE